MMGGKEEDVSSVDGGVSATKVGTGLDGRSSAYQPNKKSKSSATETYSLSDPKDLY